MPLFGFATAALHEAAITGHPGWSQSLIALTRQMLNHRVLLARDEARRFLLDAIPFGHWALLDTKLGRSAVFFDAVQAFDRLNGDG